MAKHCNAGPAGGAETSRGGDGGGGSGREFLFTARLGAGEPHTRSKSKVPKAKPHRVKGSAVTQG